MNSRTKISTTVNGTAVTAGDTQVAMGTPPPGWTGPLAIDSPATTAAGALTQVAGHASHTVKLLPPLIITEEDCAAVECAFDKVVAATHRVPGAVWSLGKTLVGNAMQARG